MSRIHQLYHKYQQGLHSVELINRDEAERRLSLEALALRDAKAALEDLASEKELRTLFLEESVEALRTELLETKRQSSEQESRLRQQRDEIQSLKIDVEYLNSSAEASNGALQDKATLTRELESLRPQLDQLKSQLASHQAVVASNGDLQRQVSTLEVQLENEKRLTARSQKTDEKGAISDLRFKLQQCEAKFNTERQEKENLKRELTDSRADTDLHKERCGVMKIKLKELQSAFKDAQADLQKNRRELSIIRKTPVNIIEEPQSKSPKFKRARVSVESQSSAVDTALDNVDTQTSGDQNISETRQQRRRGADHALVGEKSNFSITPFLNKSRGATDYAELDSDKFASGVDSEDSPRQPHARKRKTSRVKSPAKAQHPTPKGRKLSTSLIKDNAGASTLSSRPLLNESNTLARFATSKRARLLKVTDAILANDYEADPVSETACQNPELKPDALSTQGDGPEDQGAEAEGQKKKRKLLGGRVRTMFDDDEVETNDDPSTLLRGASAKRARAQLRGVANAFAGPGSTFSPLKKERRGVNASFIG